MRRLVCALVPGIDVHVRRISSGSLSRSSTLNTDLPTWPLWSWSHSTPFVTIDSLCMLPSCLLLECPADALRLRSTPLESILYEIIPIGYIVASIGASAPCKSRALELAQSMAHDSDQGESSHSILLGAPYQRLECVFRLWIFLHLLDRPISYIDDVEPSIYLHLDSHVEDHRWKIVAWRQRKAILAAVDLTL